MYELRAYYYAPGKAEALNRRMADHTVALFARHGIEVVGFWEPQDASKLVYLVRFKGPEQREEAWKRFQADPEWQSIKAESEKEGPLFVSQDSTLLWPTPYSPLK